MQTILITGGTGFIGSNFIYYFLATYPQYHIVNLDLLTYATSLDNVKEVNNHPRYSFVQGDICDKSLLKKLFKQFSFIGVIHFAAESHVDNSIKKPRYICKNQYFRNF